MAAEGLENPAQELPPIVKYFAERGKISNIHFRNIRGGLHDFCETWLDEGDVNMYELIRVSRGGLPIHGDAGPRAVPPG